MLHLKEHFAGKSHVIWDWNGTLLDDLDLCVEIVSSVAEAQIGRPLTKGEYLEGFRFPVREWYRDLGFNFEQLSFEALSDQFVARYGARAPGLTLFDGVHELLDELNASGKGCSILTAAHEKSLHELLTHFGIAKFFHAVFGLGDFLAKGKLERGRELIAHLALPERELILVGDTDHDLEVAQELGIDAVLLEGGHQSGARLRARHDRVFARGS